MDIVRPASPFARRFKKTALGGGGRCAARLLLLALAAPLAIAAGLIPLRHEEGKTLPADVAAKASLAEASMRRAEEFIRARKMEAGLPVEGRDRGLVGDELTPLTTTLGSLSSKRTAQDPRWAGVLVERLWAAGLRKGDFVAASYSGSFPGLNLALAAACQSLGLRLAVVSSVTASTYGANQIGFTWPEMEVLLSGSGYLEPVSIGVAAGGAKDSAADLEPEARSLASGIASRSAKALGAAYLESKDLASAAEARMSLYHDAAGGKRISLFVNVGGGEASLGSSETVIELSSGFLPPYPFDLSKERGVMAMMMEEGVPVLSLLNVKDLALRWGVPIDE